jgi:hypothetical protein
MDGTASRPSRSIDIESITIIYLIHSNISPTHPLMINCGRINPKLQLIIQIQDGRQVFQERTDVFTVEKRVVKRTILAVFIHGKSSFKSVSAK